MLNAGKIHSVVRNTVVKNKMGVTLVEVLVVVAIMGILSGVGVSSLRQAVMNNRIKDAALNTTAFLERVANESNRLSSPLCLKKMTPQTINVYKGTDCSSVTGDAFTTLAIDSPMQFVSGNGCSLTGANWIDNSNAANAVFKPKFGLSAAPSEGFICIQYGSEELYGAAQKLQAQNAVKAQWKTGASGSWMNL